jgi:hypothetical protein
MAPHPRVYAFKPELTSELVIGLPVDFATAPPEKYNRNPEEYTVGADYIIPGHYLSLVDESITFTIGQGTDQLGDFVPASACNVMRCRLQHYREPAARTWLIAASSSHR